MSERRVPSGLDPPGCVAAGETIDAAIAEARHAFRARAWATAEQCAIERLLAMPARHVDETWTYPGK